MEGRDKQYLTDFYLDNLNTGYEIKRGIRNGSTSFGPSIWKDGIAID